MAALFGVGITQVLVPVWKGEKIFPVFRPSREKRLKQALRSRLKGLEELETEEQIAELERLADEKRQRLIAAQQSYDPLNTRDTTEKETDINGSATKVTRIRDRQR